MINVKIIIMLTERVTLEELIQVPVDKELTNLEKKAAASLASRMIHHQGDTVTLPRRGRVSKLFLINIFVR